MKDLFPEEPSAEEPDDADQRAVHAALAEVMDERGLEEGDMALMLIEIAFHFRAIGYVVATEKPSEGGLRLELDRFRKFIDDVHRDYRKNAGEVLKGIVAMLDAVAKMIEAEDPDRDP